MKLQLSKKLFAFIIAIMMLSGIPGIIKAQQSIANAQSRLESAYPSCQTCIYFCGCGLSCRQGHCRRVLPFNTDPIHTNEVLSLSDHNSADFSLQLSEAQYVSVKIYDVTGRLIRTIADAESIQENQFEWDKADSAGESVSPGLYILKLDAGPGYAGTQKHFVVN